MWGDYMEIGDLVLDPDMKRCIVFARSRKPSRIVQVSRFGEVVESEWVKVVCVRSGHNHQPEHAQRTCYETSHQQSTGSHRS